MRKKTSFGGSPPQMDNTPMIDVTFQLVTFFLFTLNFGADNQDERIKLPDSELAKPPEAGAQPDAITLQLTKQGVVLFAGENIAVEAMGKYLVRERQVLEAGGKKASDAMVIIRADADAQTGRVQQLIQECEKTGFEKFTLRAKQTTGT